MTCLSSAAISLLEVSEWAREETRPEELADEAGRLVEDEQLTAKALEQAERGQALVSPDGTADADKAWQDVMRTVARLRMRMADIALKQAMLCNEMDRETWYAKQRLARQRVSGVTASLKQ